MTTDATRPVRLLASYAWDAPGAEPGLQQYLHEGAAAVTAAAQDVGAAVTLVNSLAPTAEPQTLAQAADAIVILGGSDVDPAHYGRTPQVPEQRAIHPHADAFELSLIRSAMGAQQPVFGICRGMQLLNVACGGTLTQDLGPDSMHAPPGQEETARDHTVALTERSHAASIFGGTTLTVRSGHHQAIDTLGNRLAVTARAPDGVVEAIEHADTWALGVQWHPEDPGSDPSQLAALLEAVSHAGRRFAQDPTGEVAQ